MHYVLRAPSVIDLRLLARCAKRTESLVQPHSMQHRASCAPQAGWTNTLPTSMCQNRKIFNTVHMTIISVIHRNQVIAYVSQTSCIITLPTKSQDIRRWIEQQRLYSTASCCCCYDQRRRCNSIKSALTGRSSSSRSCFRMRANQRYDSLHSNQSMDG